MEGDLYVVWLYLGVEYDGCFNGVFVVFYLDCFVVLEVIVVGVFWVHFYEVV